MCVLVYRFVRIEFLERIFLSPRTNPDKARSALLLGSGTALTEAVAFWISIVVLGIPRTVSIEVLPLESKN
jgi:hypothetical protein